MKSVKNEIEAKKPFPRQVSNRVQNQVGDAADEVRRQVSFTVMRQVGAAITSHWIGISREVGLKDFRCDIIRDLQKASFGLKINEISKK